MGVGHKFEPRNITIQNKKKRPPSPVVPQQFGGRPGPDGAAVLGGAAGGGAVAPHRGHPPSPAAPHLPAEHLDEAPQPEQLAAPLAGRALCNKGKASKSGRYIYIYIYIYPLYRGIYIKGRYICYGALLLFNPLTPRRTLVAPFTKISILF